MSSSGSLATAIAFKKPFILSKKLAQLLNASDIQYALKQIGLNQNDIIFSLKSKNLIKAVKFALRPKINKKLIALSKLIAERRSFMRLSPNLSNVLFYKEKRSSKTSMFNFLKFLHIRLPFFENYSLNSR